MKRFLLALALLGVAAGTQAQFSIRRSPTSPNQVQILYTAPALGGGIRPARFFQFALQIPNSQNGQNITATFTPGAPLASILAFNAKTGTDFGKRTFVFVAAGGQPNYAAVYNFGLPGTESVLGTVTFAASSGSVNNAIVAAIDYQNQAQYGGSTDDAIWTFQLDPALGDVTQYNNLFYQSQTAGGTAGSGAPAPNFDGGVANQSVAISSTPLPIELISFSATATPERTAKLEWQTATEKNSSHFIVERSADGLRFTDQVCRMQAAGTSNELLTYHNFDYKPLTGSNYYRLKMVDKDGSFKYSETRRLVFEAPLADVAAIPNPFQNATSIRVSADQAQMANYYVVDLAGRVIKSGVWEVAKGVQEFPMPLEDAAAGNYILTVQGSTILAEVRLTKSN